jgi:hypothetical protein
MADERHGESPTFDEVAAGLRRDFPAFAVVDFAREIDRSLLPWQELLVHEVFDAPPRPAPNRSR